MTKSENKIVAYFLDQFSDIAGNAGCNDLPSGFFNHMSDDEEEDFRIDFIKWVGDSDYEIDNMQDAHDWMVASYLRDRIKNES